MPGRCARARARRACPLPHSSAAPLPNRSTCACSTTPSTGTTRGWLQCGTSLWSRCGASVRGVVGAQRTPTHFPSRVPRAASAAVCPHAAAPWGQSVLFPLAPTDIPPMMDTSQDLIVVYHGPQKRWHRPEGTDKGPSASPRRASPPASRPLPPQTTSWPLQRASLTRCPPRPPPSRATSWWSRFALPVRVRGSGVPTSSAPPAAAAGQSGRAEGGLRELRLVPLPPANRAALPSLCPALHQIRAGPAVHRRPPLPPARRVPPPGRRGERGVQQSLRVCQHA